MVDKGSYVDPHLLSKTFFEKKAAQGLGKSTTSAQEKQLDQLGFTLRDEAKVSYGIHLQSDFQGFLEGLCELYMMWAKSPLMSKRLQYFVPFFLKVLHYKYGSPADKIRFCKKFMLEYQAEDDWPVIFKQSFLSLHSEGFPGRTEFVQTEAPG